MAETQPELFKFLSPDDEPAPLADSAIRVDLMSNVEIRVLGRTLTHEFWTDDAMEESVPSEPSKAAYREAEAINVSLATRYDAALKALGRDLPLRGYELVEEIIADPESTAYDMTTAAHIADGISYVDPIAALEKLRELQPIAATRHDGDFAYEFKNDGYEIGLDIAARFPGAGNIPVSIHDPEMITYEP